MDRRIALPFVVREGFKWYNRGIADPTPEMFALETTYKLQDVRKGGHIFVDIGANMGLWTVIASAYFDHVYSFEPNPEVYEILKKNLELNNVKNVTAENAAISDHDGRLHLNRYYNHAWSSALIAHNGREAEGEGWDAQSYQLDTVLLKDIVPTLVKIDTEGHEFNILNGMGRILRTQHPKLLMEIHSWKDYEPISHLLQDYGYIIRQPDLLHVIAEQWHR